MEDVEDIYEQMYDDGEEGLGASETDYIGFEKWLAGQTSDGDDDGDNHDHGDKKY